MLLIPTWVLFMISNDLIHSFWSFVDLALSFHASWETGELVRVIIIIQSELPYFFGYKTECFFFQNNPKDLDPSCKTDLDLLDCLGRVNLVL